MVGLLVSSSPGRALASCVYSATSGSSAGKARSMISEQDRRERKKASRAIEQLNAAAPTAREQAQ